VKKKLPNYFVKERGWTGCRARGAPAGINVYRNLEKNKLMEKGTALLNVYVGAGFPIGGNFLTVS
jgi:hypothetical protein